MTNANRQGNRIINSDIRAQHNNENKTKKTAGNNQNRRIHKHETESRENREQNELKSKVSKDKGNQRHAKIIQVSNYYPTITLG